jgi:hypothetical protein
MKVRLKYYYRLTNRLYFKSLDGKLKISLDCNYRNNPELLEGLKRDKKLKLIIQ